MRRYPVLVVVLGCLAVAGCGGPSESARPRTLPTVTAPSAPSPSPRATPPAGTVPPSWLGTQALPTDAEGVGVRRPTPAELRVRRFTLPDSQPALPGNGFESVVTTPAPADVIARSTWAPGCPVAARDLSWVRVAFWGFDNRRHTGELLVHRSAAGDLVEVFRRLYDARFPIEQMRVTTKAEESAPPTGDGNNTGAFVCRAVRGSRVVSQHAYGLAVDINPFQNPYSKGDLLLPELAGAYLDRSWTRPGMILAGGPVVAAFDDIGWTWGGSWRSLKDLHHFSRNGR